MVSRALVLGGGGSTGFAWQWGLLTGLHDAGVRLGGADLLVGTSAGAAAAVELAATSNPRELLAFMMSTSKNTGESGIDGNFEMFTRTLHRLAAEGYEPAELRARIGAMALAAQTAPEATFRQIVTGYIRVRQWPEQLVRLTAVDAHSGKRIVFDKDSVVPVVDAVAASCAAPGVWAPITIGESHYIDGGVHSPTNADLAAGHERVVVIAPVPELRELPGGKLSEQLADVEAEGKATVVTPDEKVRELIGNNLMDLSRRPSITQAGLDQGRAIADTLGAFWDG